MTSESYTLKEKKACLHNVSFHANFHQNRFIDECARKKKLKSRKDRNITLTLFFSQKKPTYMRTKSD